MLLQAKKAKEQKVQRNTEIFLKVSSKFHFKYLTRLLRGLYHEQSITYGLLIPLSRSILLFKGLCRVRVNVSFLAVG